MFMTIAEYNSLSEPQRDIQEYYENEYKDPEYRRSNQDPWIPVRILENPIARSITNSGRREQLPGWYWRPYEAEHTIFQFRGPFPSREDAENDALFHECSIPPS